MFAATLREMGITSELVDLLQSRLPMSGFVQYYYKPDMAKARQRCWRH